MPLGDILSGFFAPARRFLDGISAYPALRPMCGGQPHDDQILRSDGHCRRAGNPACRFGQYLWRIQADARLALRLCPFLPFDSYRRVPAAAFQRLRILPSGEDDCLTGTLVIAFDKEFNVDLPSKEEILEAENLVRAELEREGIGDFNYCMKVSRATAGKMIIMHVRPLSKPTPGESPPKRSSHIFYIQNGTLRGIEKNP